MIRKDTSYWADQEGFPVESRDVPEMLRWLDITDAEHNRAAHNKYSYSYLPDAIPECFGADAP